MAMAAPFSRLLPHFIALSKRNYTNSVATRGRIAIFLLLKSSKGCCPIVVVVVAGMIAIKIAKALLLLTISQPLLLLPAVSLIGARAAAELIATLEATLVLKGHEVLAARLLFLGAALSWNGGTATICAVVNIIIIIFIFVIVIVFGDDLLDDVSSGRVLILLILRLAMLDCSAHHIDIIRHLADPLTCGLKTLPQATPQLMLLQLPLLPY